MPKNGILIIEITELSAAQFLLEAAQHLRIRTESIYLFQA